MIYLAMSTATLPVSSAILLRSAETAGAAAPFAPSFQGPR